MKTYELTAKQIQEIDEISLDKKAADDTLKVALNYHSNRINNLIKKERAWWEEMRTIHNLDNEKTWMVDFKSPVLCIKEKKENQSCDCPHPVRDGGCRHYDIKNNCCLYGKTNPAGPGKDGE